MSNRSAKLPGLSKFESDSGNAPIGIRIGKVHADNTAARCPLPAASTRALHLINCARRPRCRELRQESSEMGLDPILVDLEGCARPGSMGVRSASTSCQRHPQEG